MSSLMEKKAYPTQSLKRNDSYPFNGNMETWYQSLVNIMTSFNITLRQAAHFPWNFQK